MSVDSSYIFNQQAIERLHNPDDLDRYLRVTNPGVWVVFGAVLSLLIGLAAWGFFGSVITSVEAKSAYVDGKLVCFLDEERLTYVNKGDTAVIDEKPAVVASVSEVPVSLGEAKEVLGNDYLVSTLFKEDWAYMVTFENDADFPEGVPLTTNITTEHFAPIQLILDTKHAQ